jgi:hypothetical protein
MKTFTSPRELIFSESFGLDRKRAIADINVNDLDKPLINIVEQFNTLPFCFTLQCCYGHFLYPLQQDPNNLDPLPGYDTGPITYRIAYLAFCIKENSAGKNFCKVMEKVQDMDRDYIQFGSADWFRERCPNSFVLQVEPRKYKYQDQALLDWKEAVHVEETRRLFFERIKRILAEENLKIRDS